MATQGRGHALTRPLRATPPWNIKSECAPGQPVVTLPEVENETMEKGYKRLYDTMLHARCCGGSMAIDLNDYVEVAERIRAFYERYPTGSIRTELIHLDDELVIFKASVYRDRDDRRPTTGWAYERIDSSPVNRRYFVENCETSAVGRALANRNFAGSRRPSREEMAKVQRLRREARVMRGRGRAAGRESTGSAARVPTEERIRRLVGRLRLSPSKRQRIEEKLRSNPSPQELHDLEAYLLALRPRLG